MDIVKQIIVESGEINPENDNDQTPSQLATWNHHLTLSELFEHMNNMMEKNELELFGWPVISNEMDLPFEEDLQRIMYSNDCPSLKKYLKKEKLTVLQGCLKINSRDLNPLMTASEFFSKEALLIMLQYLIKIAMEEKGSENADFCDQILHGSKTKGLLSLVMTTEYYAGQIRLLVIEYEGFIHDWQSTEFEKCLFKHLGTNDKSLECKEIFKERNVEEKGVGKVTQILVLVSTVTISLQKTTSVSFDVSTDVALLSKYASNLTQVTQCSDATTVLAKLKSPGRIECFIWTLVPITLSCIFLLKASITFMNRKIGHPFQSCIWKFVVAFLSPVWLGIVSMLQGRQSYLTKINDDSSKGRKKIEYVKELDVAFNDAKMIEVSTESMLQPILQVHLFIISLMCALSSLSENIHEKCLSLGYISLLSILQLFSFLSSVISIPKAFTQTYTINKEGMLKTEAKIVYFLFMLFGVVSRLLSIELLTITLVVSDLGVFSHIYGFIGVHLFLVFMINLFTSKRKQDQDTNNCCWKIITFVMDHLMKALRNLYIPWSDGKNEEEDVLRQSLIEMLNILENIAISVFGNIMWPQENVDDQLISFQLIMMVIWISYSCYIAFKLVFFLLLHPWSSLVKEELKKTIKRGGCLQSGVALGDDKDAEGLGKDCKEDKTGKYTKTKLTIYRRITFF